MLFTTFYHEIVVWYVKLKSLGYGGSLRSFIKNHLKPNSIVKTTLLRVELICCLQVMSRDRFQYEMEIKRHVKV